ncbi:signal peptidase I [Brevibacillus fortis]|uniref:Signal peptidase I n=1 Tax=Brevibacillus fortis TaxID=2126352 RepID=A0A2P7UKC7_9BACL|nr:signal peptidase I [Brevibacillus fortis]PSJ87263.1 signal peptidase I [Brevibacillus fortis]
MKTLFLMLSFIFASFTSVQPDQSKSVFISEGESMAPTLSSNDQFLVDKTFYDSHPIQRGDIVIFQVEKDRQHVKRVIALPGETLEYKGDILYINNKVVDEPYLASAKNVAKKENLYLTEDFGPITIPGDTIFVLGDNRLNSLDSRVIGPVHVNEILGKMTNKLPSN